MNKFLLLFNSISVNFVLFFSGILVLAAYITKPIDPNFYFVDLILVIANIMILLSVLEIKKSFLFVLYISLSILTLIASPFLNIFIEHNFSEVTFFTDALLLIYMYHLFFIFFYRFITFSKIYSNPIKPFALKKISILNNQTITKCKLWFENIEVSDKIISVIVFLLFLISILSEVFLSNLGRIAGSQVLKGPITQILLILINLKLFVYFFSAKKMLQNNDRKYLWRIIVIFVGTIILLTGIVSGYRYEIAIFLVLNIFLFYNFIILNKYKMIIFCFFSGVIFLFLFELMYIYRNSSDSFIGTIYNYFFLSGNNFSSIFLNLKEIFLNIIMDRLNYAGAIQIVSDNLYQRSFIDFQYNQNLTSLIPRALWEDKPLIGLDYNLIGIKLSLINSTDKLTSVNLHVIGESFYLLGYFGFFVAFFQATIFYFLEKINQNKSNLAMIFLYFMLAIEVCHTGTYVTIIPRIVLLSLIYSLLAIIFSRYKHTN